MHQIIIANKLHSSVFPGTAIYRKFLRDELNLISSPRFLIFPTTKKINNLPFELTGLSAARRVVPLKVKSLP